MTLLKNGNVYTMEDDRVKKCDILFDENGIIEISDSIEQREGCEVIDCTGDFIMPGLIDAHCHIGLWEDGEPEDEGDGNEMAEPITPQLRAIDAVNPMDNSFKEARESGVTCVVTGPGSANVLGGQFFAMKTAGICVDEMAVKNPIAVKAAFGENPKKVYGGQQKSPTTRMTSAAMLRETLMGAKEYLKKLEKKKGDKPDKDIKMEALKDVIKGKLPLKIHAHRADDILTAIRICKEFDLKFTIDHCTEGHLIPGYIKESGAGIIVGPLMADRSKVELKNLTFKAPKILNDNGIEFAICTDHPVIPIQYIAISAAIAVREGLDELCALRAITINPAKICGIDDRVGSLKVGKDADIAVFDGNVLDFKTKPKYVFIDGKMVYGE